MEMFARPPPLCERINNKLPSLPPFLNRVYDKVIYLGFKVV